METFDAAIVGAGVVGCAVARRLALDGARVVVLEAAADILDGASKGNSAILHTGFDATPGTREAALVAAGHAEYLAIHERLGLPLIRSGALVLAWSEEEAARLPALMDKARANGVDDVEPLDAAASRAREPALAPRVAGGFVVPGEYLIDPWSAPLAYLAQALANGAALRRGSPVERAEWDGALWRLETPRGLVAARLVVGAAGLHGDRLDALITGRTRFTIRPRKGQFVVYDKPAAALARHILLPVPTPVTKGVVVCRTAFGNLLVGPTAEEQEDRTRAECDGATLAALRARGEAILPALAEHDVTAFYAGLRPACEHQDYQIALDAERRYLSLGAIRSTGLSAALGIARHASELVGTLGLGWSPPADPVWPRVPNLAEAGERDWQRAGHGGIVCHCERATRREIEAALDGPLGATTPAGLKRRTRVTMGRCQGFYCTAELARITAGRLVEPIGADDGG